MSRFNRTISLIVTGVIGLALLLGINVVAGKNTWRLDLTAGKLFSLSPQTVSVLKDLKKEVNAVAFFYPQSPDKGTTKEMLDLYKKESDFFDYEFVDPDREPHRAKEYGVNKFPVVVLVSEERQEKVQFPSEEDIINGVVRVTDVTNRKVYFVEGHGELDSYDTGNNGITRVKEMLKSQGMEVNILALALSERIPEDASVLAIPGPKKDFLDTELRMLTDYLDNGGRVFVSLSAEERTNLEDFITERLHIQRMEGLIVDKVSEMRLGDARFTLVQKYSDHPITANFRDMVTMYPTAFSLRPKFDTSKEDDNSRVNLLGRTTHEAWLETDISSLKEGAIPVMDQAVDTQGPLSLIATYEIVDPAPETDEQGNPIHPQPEEKEPSGPKPRAAVYADQDFMTNQYVQFGGNLDLIRNTFNWLMERENILNLTKKRENIFMLLRPYQAQVMTWVPRAVVPIAALIMALCVTILRRPRKSKS